MIFFDVGGAFVFCRPWMHIDHYMVIVLSVFNLSIFWNFFRLILYQLNNIKLSTVAGFEPTHA